MKQHEIYKLLNMKVSCLGCDECDCSCKCIDCENLFKNCSCEISHELMNNYIRYAKRNIDLCNIVDAEKHYHEHITPETIELARNKYKNFLTIAGSKVD